MILVDTILKKRARENNPIRVGVVGAGEMAKGLINQITKHTPGMMVIATYNRNLDKPIDAYKLAGIENFNIVESFSELESSLNSNIPVITQNIDLLIKSKDMDLLVDLTGSIKFSTFLTLEAIKNKKHILSFNAELDATIGPILKYKADKAGVKYSVAEGDQPGVTLNLYRFVVGMGFEPLLCGNIKGMLDHYRNPSTQEKFAKQWGMSPVMATNFADGSKIAFEQACIANATGMKVAKRGMLGYESKEHVDDLTHLYDVDELRKMGGIVDFIVGAKPGPGVFVYATSNDPHQIKYLEYNKLGKGPLYSFYIPYHLLFFEIPISIARMIDLDDTIVAAKDGPVVDVITVAKVDLNKGDVLDEIGGYKTYGLCENYSTARKENLLPMGLVNGCKVIRNIPKDKELTFDDVEIPDNSLIYKIWIEQRELFDI
jgi:predicted homoserine dehydrogenase-like protein